MHITANGKTQDISEGASVKQLMDLLKIRSELVAVELNREIVPRARHAEHRLKEGDVIEFVTFVGGG